MFKEVKEKLYPARTTKRDFVEAWEPGSAGIVNH